MMPVEWPLAASAADHPVEPARLRAGSGRLGTATRDFFLDEHERLTDEERALMAAMLRGLVGDIVDELVASLPPTWSSHAEQARIGVYRRLRQSRLLERPDLVALLLRRADERQLSLRGDRQPDSAIAALVGDVDPAVAEAAMALTLARGRRRDRYGRLGLEFDDLPAEEAVVLVHAIAATMRDGLGEGADQPLVSAARALLARHDEGRRLEASVAALARALAAVDRSADTVVRALALDGEAALLTGLLAERAGIDLIDAWDLFSGGEGMMLARLAGCERATAAQMLAAFDMMSGGGAPERLIDRFDTLSDEAVETCRQWLRLDPHYRASRDALVQHDG
ncbi:MAG TPA: hypothetical protein VNA29_06180 [Sphingomicrobium sp.]|nr:hypothetical protein [Sphingomicrobium sp.]